MSSTDIDLLTRHPWVTRRSLTVSDYHRMGDAGILTEHDRVELIEGALVTMAPIGSDHSGMVNTLTRLLVRAVGDRGIVAVQNPVRLDDLSEPQPDFAILRPRGDDYRRSIPTPSDVLLIIEVANSSLAYDRAIKRALYARHDIPEFWIVNLKDQEVEICRAPSGGTWAEIFLAGHDAMLEPVLLPGVAIPVAALWG